MRRGTWLLIEPIDERSLLRISGKKRNTHPLDILPGGEKGS
jgi:hypothetical protein